MHIHAPGFDYGFGELHILSTEGGYNMNLPHLNGPGLAYDAFHGLSSSVGSRCPSSATVRRQQ